jgi:hypothetical protein
VPIKNRENGTWVKGLWVVKIKVKPGLEKNCLYTYIFKENYFNCFVRLDGYNKCIEKLDFKRKLAEKAILK